MRLNNCLIIIFLIGTNYGCKFPLFVTNRPIVEKDYFLKDKSKMSIETSDWRVNGIFLTTMTIDDSSIYFTYFKFYSDSRVYKSWDTKDFPNPKALCDTINGELGYYTIKANGKILIELHEPRGVFYYLTCHFDGKNLVIEKFRYRNFLIPETKAKDKVFDYISLSELSQ